MRLNILRITLKMFKVIISVTNLENYIQQLVNNCGLVYLHNLLHGMVVGAYLLLQIYIIPNNISNVLNGGVYWYTVSS